MRTTGMTLLVLAVPPLPAIPPLPQLPPPLPEIQLPGLSTPAATPTPAARPASAPTPAWTPAPAARPQSTAVAAATATASPASPPALAIPARPPAAPRTVGRRTAARPVHRAPRRRVIPRASSPARSPARATTPRPAARRPVEAASEPSLPGRVGASLSDLGRAIPAALLWTLFGFAALAAGLTGNAYRQSRRRAALETQRALLLDDLGLLSQALLPPVPEGLDGVAVSAAYRPADGPAAGGDFYDVFGLGDGRTCVLLGDVSGHGRETVAKAALARYTLRTLLAAGHTPGEALARADRLLVRDLRPAFATVIAGIHDGDTGVLTYAKAGHAPPIVLGAPHDPDAEQPVPPIGLGVGEVWPEYRVELRDGVSVCLFTDGLEDAHLGDARVGRSEVERLLAAHDVPDASRLLGDLESLADGMSDDTAAVVLSHRCAPIP